jgi:hypothetical protein
MKILLIGGLENLGSALINKFRLNEDLEIYVIAYRKGWISTSKFSEIASKYKNDYGKYLLKLVENF